MLSSALYNYLESWEQIQFRVPVDKLDFKKGWINGYKIYFSKNFDIHFDQAPINLSLLEDIVLARNRVQHPEYIMMLRTSYAHTDISKLHHPFFIDDKERKFLDDIERSESAWLFPPSIHVSKDKLFEAILEVEKFIDWLEEQINTKFYGRGPNNLNANINCR